MAVHTRRGEPHQLLARTYAIAHTDNRVVLIKMFPRPDADAAAILCCARPVSSPYLLTHWALWLNSTAYLSPRMSSKHWLW